MKGKKTRLGVVLFALLTVCSVAGAGASAAGSASESTAVGPADAAAAAGSAEIVDYVTFVDAGDTAAIEVALENTTTAELRFSGPYTDYTAAVTVTDGNGDGTVVLRFDTAAAGGESETFGVADDADSVTVHSEASLAEPLESVDLRVTALVDGTVTDSASLLVRMPDPTATATPTGTPTSSPAATATETPTATGGGATATSTSGSSDSSQAAPGFGPVVALLALLGAALLARR